MNSSDYILKKPRSKASFEQLFQTYKALDEKTKVRFLRYLHKHIPEMFGHLVKHAHLSRGVSEPKVIARTGNYGATIDKWLGSGTDDFFLGVSLCTWLRSIGGHSHQLRDQLPNDGETAAQLGRIENYILENSDDPMAVLAGRWMAAFVNFEGEDFRSGLFCRRTETEEDGSDAEDPSSDSPELSGTDSILAELDGSSGGLIALSKQLADTARWDQVGWDAALSQARQAVENIHAEVERLAGDAGAEPPVWNTRTELEELLARLEGQALDKGSSKVLAEFLRSLAAEIRTLLPVHKLASRRKVRETLRDAAAQELEGVSAAGSPAWPDQGPREARDWLAWAKNVEGAELETLIESLQSHSYTQTAELAAELEISYAIPLSKDAPAVEVADAAGETPVEDAPVQDAPVEDAKAEKPDLAAAEPSVPMQGSQGPEKSAIQSEEPRGGAEPEAAKPQPHRLTLLHSVEDSAQAVLTAGDKEVEECVESAIWHLLDSGECALAFQLARLATDEQGMTEVFPVPAEILELLALLPVYSAGSPEVEERSRELLASVNTEVFKENEHEDNIIRRLLLAAALFLPAILNKTSNAAPLLAEIKLGKAGQIQKLQVALGEFAASPIMINPAILAATLDEKGWREREEDLRGELRAFRANATKRNIRYAPSTQIWRHWFAPKGLFSRLFDLADIPSSASIKDLRQQINAVDIQSEIEEAWRHEKGKGSLVGSALAQLNRYASEAISHLKRLADHWEASQNFGGDQRKVPIHKLANAFEKTCDAAVADLDAYLDSEISGSLRKRVVRSLVLREIERVRRFLDGTDEGWGCQDLGNWLKADLLRVKDLRFDGSWDFKPSAGDDPRLFSPFIRGLIQPLMSWPEAAERALGSGDHLAARRILDRMAITMPPPEMDLLESRKASALEQTVAKMRRNISAAQAGVSGALAKGWLTAEEYVGLQDQVQNLRANLEDATHGEDRPYNLWEDQLARVQMQIEHRQAQQIHSIREEVAKLKIGTEDDHRKILQVLETGDVSLATDYLIQLKEEGALQYREAAVSAHFFRDFFVGEGAAASVSEELSKILNQKGFTPGHFLQRIESGEELAGFVLEDEVVRAEICGAIKEWLSWARDQQSNESRVATMLGHLGFPPAKVQRRQPGCFHAVFDGQILCPVPDFGSNLGGKLEIICDTRSTTAEDALGTLAKLGLGHKSVLLLWFKPVTPAVRRSFARICHSKAQKVILVDTLLALYLFLRNSEKLRALFECSLPFTHVTPYSTAGGALPDEMFFGRQHQIRAIQSMDQNGACFVYGGRQIGKTVLLRKVAKDFALASKKHVALYLDLNHYSVGTEAAMDDVWRIMAEELRKRNQEIFGNASNLQMGAKPFRNSVVDWLQKDEERRILILLDEADSMLKADGEREVGNEQFNLCHHLKGLMDSTGRRFKVVFAGLHNVQRTTRVANNPLAQLGDPICVEPLMHNGEAKQAFRLVAEPFAIAGVEFDDRENIINSILARTNYYPNLIQIVASRLLRAVIDRQLGASIHAAPPCRVTAADMEAIFNLPDVRAELRQKLLLTLDLDKRYSLVAHIVALDRQSKPEGMTVDEIHSDAKTWWEAGCTPDPKVSADVERDEFVTLLHEMCGLGILRQPEREVFCLRSPNVASLLGNVEQIEAVLMSASSWELPEPYSPDTFRGLTRQGWPSPLTAKNENLMLDSGIPLSVVVGTDASGIREVVGRLKEKANNDYLLILDGADKLARFEEVLGELKDRKSDGKTLLIVPPGCPWDLAWMSEASARLSRLTSHSRAAGVVFLADPDTVWELVHQWKQIQISAGGGYIQLGPWSKGTLKKFLSDAGKMLVDQGSIDAVRRATGMWPSVLHLLKSAMDSPDWREECLRDGTFPERAIADFPLDKAFGIADDIRMSVLHSLADFSPEKVDDLAEYLSQDKKIDRASVIKVLDWATIIRLVAQQGDLVEIDPFLQERLRKRAFHE